MADNFRLPATPTGDPGTGPLMRTVDDGIGHHQVVRLGGGHSPIVESGSLTAAQPLPGTVVAGGTVGGVSDVGHLGNVQITVSGTYVGALMFEASPDGGTSWYPQAATREDTMKPEFLTATLTNLTATWQADLAGFNRFRVRMPTRTSGTAVILIDYGAHPFMPSVGSVPHQPPGAIPVNFFTDSIAMVATAATLVNLAATRDLAAPGAATATQTVPTNKTFRPLGFTVSHTSGTAAVRRVIFRLVAVKTGTAVAGSASLLTVISVNPVATIGAAGDNQVSGAILPELGPGYSFGVTAHLDAAAAGSTVSISLYGIEY